jgi:hypothetical protein
MTEAPKNGTPAPIVLPPEQAVAYMYFDLAIHMLTGMASQLTILKQESVARIFQRTAEHMAEKRNGFLRQCQTGIQVVGADALPRDPERPA